MLRQTTNENGASSFASFDRKEVFILLHRHLGSAGIRPEWIKGLSFPPAIKVTYKQYAKYDISYKSYYKLWSAVLANIINAHCGMNTVGLWLC